MNRLPQKGEQKAQPYEAWEYTAKELIEAEMLRRGIRYKQLSRMLERLGITESPDQINRKVNRRRFSAAFLVACLRAMGAETIPLK
jgi:transposase